MAFVNKKTPDPADVAIGAKIKQIRQLRGISQEKLGEQIGLTFQQIQKYEKGLNRVAGSRLIAIAKALNVGQAELVGSGADGAEPIPSMDGATRDVVVAMMATDQATRDTIRRLVRGVLSAVDEARQSVAEAA